MSMGYLFTIEGFLQSWWEILTLGKGQEVIVKTKQEKIDVLSDMQFKHWQAFHDFFKDNGKFFDADSIKKLNDYLRQNKLPEFELPPFLKGYKVRFWMFSAKYHPVILVVDAVLVKKTKEGFRVSHVLASYEPNDLLVSSK
jgi:hypothetical protein